MVAEELARRSPTIYGTFSLGVPYPSSPGERCDWVTGEPPALAIEVKMLRLMGDNGKPNDNMLMHILSPYPAHRSALTDTEKLVSSGFGCTRIVLIYGFDYPSWPLDLADGVDRAIERCRGTLRQRHQTVSKALEGIDRRMATPKRDRSIRPSQSKTNGASPKMAR